MKPKVILLMGDTAGVGPELCAKVAADLPEQADKVQLIIMGNAEVFAEACIITGVETDFPVIQSPADADSSSASVLFLDFRPVDPKTVPRAEVSASAGREVLEGLTAVIEYAKQGKIEGFAFAPFNKESMHLAGAEHTSELEMFKAAFNRPDIAGEFNLLDDQWLARVTSHVAVSQISANLSIDKIIHTMELLGETQEAAGITPKIIVAALNPHAGEHGLFGDEEGRLIEPAVASVRERKERWTIAGPVPCDTLFPRALGEKYNGIVGMYHDQLQIASKLLGLERGVTFHPGMKIPIATAAHGTAFDIQGTGRVKHTALRNALALVCEMAVKGDEV